MGGPSLGSPRSIRSRPTQFPSVPGFTPIDRATSAIEQSSSRTIVDRPDALWVLGAQQGVAAALDPQTLSSVPAK